MWVKICGMTTPAAVDAAVAAGADAIGFVFAPSVRRVAPAHAAMLAAPARGRARCVAVMQHPSQAEVTAMLAEFAPDVLQTDSEDFAALDLPASLERLPVLRAGRELPTQLPRRVLYEGARSGAGEVADWTRAAQLCVRNVEVVLAGGLTPENVDSAVRAVRPFGVDVSSGVESAPGVKSAARIAGFVAAARAAGREG
ncbi:MAG TPA: phosphoribosylanthranilate isomerase [Steroidobacteraceae bacterium]|nr:phosphoribosylanthranilate isomerase [Steroidobacteraceae bacterium]HNS26591.1 phosphoribosylanthranilate isomerase [Steroidobacteraceae bacterium]